jgi:hypothetical protein
MNIITVATRRATVDKIRRHFFSHIRQETCIFSYQTIV